jgi:hypothetical protein
MDTIINYASDSAEEEEEEEEEDQEEMLDTEWINELKNNEDKYNDFYKEPVKSVIVYLLYVNKENELQHIHKDRCLIDNNKGILKREIIITFIKRYHHLFSVNYKLFSLLKYNIDLEPTEVEHFSSKKNESIYENRFIHSEKHLNDIHFTDTIHMFQDLNALFFIFNECASKPVVVSSSLSAIESSKEQNTKRINMTVTKRNNKNGNHAKTKRMYPIKKT